MHIRSAYKMAKASAACLSRQWSCGQLLLASSDFTEDVSQADWYETCHTKKPLNTWRPELTAILGEKLFRERVPTA